MDTHKTKIFFLLLLFNFSIHATDTRNTNDTESEDRQPRVSGRIVKLYSGTRPEPIYCPQEGFQADPVDCAIFYRCVKGANNKYTVFRFQCGPGTVYDPDTEVCNFPQSTKRSACGGILLASTDRSNENEIEGMRPEVPSPILTRPVYSEPNKDSTTQTAYPWATPKPENSQSSSTAYAWINTASNQESSTGYQSQPSGQEGDICTKDGFVGDSENCRKFYRCVANQRGGFMRYEFSCSETTVWDDDVQSCNHPWAVQRSRCGRSTDSNIKPFNINNQSSNNKASSGPTVQEQLQINYGDKVTQTQTQISHGNVIQNQTQINYGDRNNKKQNSQNKQNQTQISHGSAISQTQTHINYGNGVQTQLQVDHTKEFSQAQSQTYETTSKTSTPSNTTPQNEKDQGYGMQQENGGKDSNDNGCTESGFMGDQNDCKKFYRCVDNGRGSYTKYEFSCGEGTVWDSSMEACNHAWAVKECGGNVPQNSPQGSSQTTTTVKPTQNYQTTLGLTTSDYSEDTGYGNQNQQSEATILITTAQPKPLTTTTSGDSSSNGAIICTSGGFKGHPNDCKKFYRCVDNGKDSYTKYEYNCGEGTVWDPDIEACNHPWAVKKCGGTADDINKIETTTVQSAVTTASIVQTTMQTSSENVDYDSGYGQQPGESSTPTTKKPQINENNQCTSSGFMGDKNDCKKFYRCVDNQNGGYTRYEFSCGEGTVWDPKIEACNHAWAVENCGGDGSENIHKETTSSGRPTMSDEEYTPSSDQQTSYATQPIPSTTHSTEQPKTTAKPSPGKECSQEGFMGDENECKKFYRCVDNGRGGFTKFEFTCGEGTVWDSEITACNHLNSVKTSCLDSSSQAESISQTSHDSTTKPGDQTAATQSTERPKTTTKPSTSKPSSGKNCSQEGFMGDEEDCKKFYRCVDNGQNNYIKYEFTCGEGTVWDSEINACNHPSSDTHCGTSGTLNNDQQSSTEPNREKDEMYTETTNGLEHSTEQNQNTVSSQKPQVIISSDNKCTSEGFYGDSNDCKKFYRCVDNGKGAYTKYEFTCGDGTVWDQEIQGCNHEPSDSKCSRDSQTNQPQTEATEKDTSTTSTTEKQQTTQKPQKPPKESSGNCTSEGFYANPEDCKMFYRCVDNGKGSYTKYDFSCGEGTMWVQEIQACDHDTGEFCTSQSESSSQTTETIASNEEPSSSSLDNTFTQPPDKQDDESLNETTSKPSSSSNNGTDKCKTEGFYPDSGDCKKFYRCVDNGNGAYTKYDFSCGEGTAWDADIQSCNHISEVKSCQAPEKEPGQPMQDEEVSQSPGFTSEGTSQTSTSGPATESSKPASEDNCEQEGYYGNSKDCTKFYRCVDNGKGGFTKYDFACGEGTIWDQDITACNHPQDVTNPSCQKNDNNDSSTSNLSTSSSTESSTNSSTSSSNTTENSSSDCSQGSTKKPDNKNVNCTKAGYYPDPNDCKKFYRCVDWDGDGKRFSVYFFECGEGTIWDPALDTCNHEDSVYPPRDCSGGSQSQGENVDHEPSTTESTTDTGIIQESTTEQTTTQESSNEQTNASEQTTTQQTTTAQSTEEQTTTQEITTSEQTTAQQTTSEQTTTQQITSQESTTQQSDSTTQQTTDTEGTTTEGTNTESSTADSSTTESSSTEISTTDSSTTDSSTTEGSTTKGSTTEGSVTESSTTESSTTEGSTTEGSTTESSTTESSTTESSTTESSPTESSSTEGTTEQSTTNQTDESGTTESSTSSASLSTDSSTTESHQESTSESSSEQTTESSSSDKECPKTDDDQNLFVCPTSFRRHPKYCNMFYQCTEDDDTHDVQIATFHCPNNTIYDESKTKCVEEKKAEKKCDGEIAQKRRLKRFDTFYKEPIVVTNERLKCPALGHYPFEQSECSSAFLKCQKTKSGKIRGFVYQCPQDYVYWSVSRRCEPKSYLRDCKKSHNDWKGRWEIPIERRNVAP